MLYPLAASVSNTNCRHPTHIEVEEDVLGLEVAVYDVAGVKRVQGKADLRRVQLATSLGELAVLLEPVEQLAATHVLEHLSKRGKYATGQNGAREVGEARSRYLATNGECSAPSPQPQSNPRALVAHRAEHM